MNEQRWDQYLQDNLNAEDNQIPQSIHQRIEDTLDSLPSQRTTKRITKRSTQISKIFASAVSILVIITFSFAYMSPAVAKYLSQLPIIGSAFEWAGDSGIKASVEHKLVESIGQIAEDQGITITLDQVMYDGTRLVIGLIHEEGISLNAVVYPNKWIKVNGVDVNAGGSAISKQMPGGLMATVYHYMSKDPLPDLFELTFIIDEVQITRDGGQTERIRGNWQFSSPVSIITEGVIGRTFDPPLTKSFEGTTVSITEVISSPVTTEVTFDIVKSEKYKQQDILRKEKPEFIVLNQLTYELMTEQGLYLEKLVGGGEEDLIHGGATKYSVLFVPLTSKSDVLTFQFVDSAHPMRKVDDISYIGTNEQRVSYTVLPHEFPLTIQQGAAGQITFNRIEYDSLNTWVEFEVHGTHPYAQISAWWIENEQGERYDFDRFDQMRIIDDGYAFRTKLPPMDPKGKLKIAVAEVRSQNILKELEFQIPLE